MRKWWKPQREESDARPPVAPPPVETEVSLPDPRGAREALEESWENKKRVDELGEEVREMIAFMRQARERNHFAEGLVEMIRKGR